MKLPRNGLWSSGAALRAGCRVPDLSLEPCDLHGAWPAMRGTAAPEHGGTGRGDEEAHISASPDGLRGRFGVLKAARIKWLGLLMSASLRRRTDCSAAPTEQTANRLALFPTLTPRRQTARRNRTVCRVAWRPRVRINGVLCAANWAANPRKVISERQRSARARGGRPRANKAASCPLCARKLRYVSPIERATRQRTCSC